MEENMIHPKTCKLIIGITVFYCVMIFSPTASFAQTLFKIGVVDTQRVVDEYKKAKEVDSILRTAVERLRSELTDIDDELRQMQEKLDKQRLFLEDEQKEMQMRNEIRLKQEEMRDHAERGQEAIDEKRKELGEPIVKEIEELIQKIGKEENFSIILEKGLVTLYVEPKYDLTDRVLKILNDKYDQEHPEQKKETSTGGKEEKQAESKEK
jgi:Skp family chaperone for outer membrane proteins